MRIPGGQSGVPGELQEVPGRKGLLRAAAQGFVLGEVKEAVPRERMEKRPSAFPSGGAVTHWECLERSACRAFHFPIHLVGKVTLTGHGARNHNQHRLWTRGFGTESLGLSPDAAVTSLHCFISLINAGFISLAAAVPPATPVSFTTSHF